MKHNVMLVISSLTGAGAELVEANLCRYLDRSKYNITVCLLKERGEKGEDLASQGLEVVGLPRSSNNGKTGYTGALKL